MPNLPSGEPEDVPARPPADEAAEQGVNGGAGGFTRRRLLAGGLVGGVVVIGAAGYGRYAFGNEFEEHVAGVLGISVPAATMLLQGAKRRLGDQEYAMRATQFLIATTPPVDLLKVGPVERRAYGQMLSVLIGDSNENIVYLGLREPSVTTACAGLVRA